MASIKSSDLAEVIKPFDLFVNASNGLYIPVLVHRPGKGIALLERNAGNAAQKRIKLGASGAVTFDHLVKLLEGDRGRKADGLVHSVFASQVARNDQDCLFMNAAAHLRLSLIHI